MVRAGCGSRRGQAQEVWHLALGLKLSAAFFSLSQVALGQHEEEYFSGPEPKAVLKKFRGGWLPWKKISRSGMPSWTGPCEYLRPSLVENSVAI